MPNRLSRRWLQKPVSIPSLAAFGLVTFCVAALGLMLYFSERVWFHPNRSEAADFVAIEKFHQQDIAATLANDPTALAATWSDDAVRMEPGGPAEVGKDTIVSNDIQDKAAHPDAVILTYRPEIRDVQIAGEWAFEWGYFNSSYQESKNAPIKTFREKFLRVLERQPDGSWKLARVISNWAE